MGKICIVISIITALIIMSTSGIKNIDSGVTIHVMAEENGAGLSRSVPYVIVYSSPTSRDALPNQEGDPVTVDYDVFVENEEDEQRSYNLALEVDNEYSSWFQCPSETPFVNAKGKVNFTVTATVPNWSKPVDVYFRVNASSKTNSSRYGYAGIGLNVLQIYGATLTARDNVYNRSLDDDDVRHVDDDREVVFFLDVTNTGTGSDEFHVYVEDYDQEEWLNIKPYYTSLSPYETELFRVTIKIPKSTPVSDESFTIIGTSSGDDHNFDLDDARDSVDLRVEITQMYNLYVTNPATTKNGQPGQPVQFEFDVNNDGNGEDRVLVKLVDKYGWPWALSSDSFTLQNKDSDESTKKITLSVEVPTTAEVRSKGYSVDLVVASNTSNGEIIHIEEGELTLTVKVEQNNEIQLSALNSDQSCGPGDSLRFKLELRNLGNGRDTVDISFTGESKNDDSFSYMKMKLSHEKITLAPFGSSYIWLNVTIPSAEESQDPVHIRAGDHRLMVNARSQTADAGADAQLNFTINKIYKFVLTALTEAPIDAPLDVSADDPNGISFYFTINNFGTVEDTVGFGTMDNRPAGWNYHFFKYGADEIQRITMEPGEERKIEVTVRFNGSTVDGIDYAGITARSVTGGVQYGLPAEDRIYINVSVPDLRITDIKFSDNPKLVDEITITVTVVNTGSGDAYDEVVLLMDGSKVIKEIPVGFLEAGDTSIMRFKFSADEGDHDYSLDLNRFNGTIDHRDEPFIPVNEPGEEASEKSGQYPYWILYVAVIFIMVVVWMALFFANKGKGGSKRKKIQRKNQVKRRRTAPDLSDDRVENRDDLIDTSGMRYNRK